MCNLLLQCQQPKKYMRKWKGIWETSENFIGKRLPSTPGHSLTSIRCFREAWGFKVSHPMAWELTLDQNDWRSQPPKGTKSDLKFGKDLKFSVSKIRALGPFKTALLEKPWKWVKNLCVSKQTLKNTCESFNIYNECPWMSGIANLRMGSRRVQWHPTPRAHADLQAKGIEGGDSTSIYQVWWPTAEMHCLEHTLDLFLETAALENPLWILAMRVFNQLEAKDFIISYRSSLLPVLLVYDVYRKIETTDMSNTHRIPPRWWGSCTVYWRSLVELLSNYTRFASHSNQNNFRSMNLSVGRGQSCSH